jgi:hypothetical protein
MVARIELGGRYRHSDAENVTNVASGAEAEPPPTVPARPAGGAAGPGTTLQNRGFPARACLVELASAADRTISQGSFAILTGKGERR